MNELIQLTNAYTRINDLLNDQEKYNLDCMDVLALEIAQKAILAIELLGIELKEQQT